ncbi:hypothetical protein [Nostoc sp. CHAB 5715]|uniref:hypothetical protein n=1 Tax=Nostoc sp. CHAB 5715 TaxID=2780400 RepID=UPI001E44DB3C|nr:hypothetical protein [Nostoc sp. CHAB 5715]MCC5624103.1 hypothetical protein [Nostoc sp. CHAB 5715]
MSRPFKMEIVESEEELKKRLQTANLVNQKEKLQMLWWIKSGQIKEQQEIGNRWQEILQQSRDGYRSIEEVVYLVYCK